MSDKRKYEEIEREVPAANSIQLFFHCRQCLEELPPDKSPQEWSQTQAGWTKLGLQVWCNRHNCNVIHLDLQNFKLPANLLTEEMEKELLGNERA